jgi:phosphoglycerol transferase MdoB-like AlkP superfamily enzyme
MIDSIIRSYRLIFFIVFPFLYYFFTNIIYFKPVYIEPISKIRLGFRARRETVKKRSIHAVCEHFEPFHNTAMDT